MGRVDDEDTGRHIRLGDLKELRDEMRQSDKARDRALEDHSDEDRASFRDAATKFETLSGEVKAVRTKLDELALDAVEQNGKLDTLIERTDGRINLLDERTVNLQARTKSRERLEEKAHDAQQADVRATRESQAIETRNTKEHRRGLVRVILGSLVAAGGAAVHWLASHL